MADVRGTLEDDVLGGTNRPDRLAGLAGDDRLRGGAGRDALLGNVGDDLLLGGPGRDRLAGGPGDDVLNGGPGRDVLTGGAGADTFVIGNIAHGLDRVIDFDPAEDALDLGPALPRFDPGDQVAGYVQLRGTAEGTVGALDPTGRGEGFRDVALLEGVQVVALPLARLGLPEAVLATPDPIPEPITRGDLVVELVEIAAVPPSSGGRPFTLINSLHHADDGSGRLFVADSRGPLYVIEGGALDRKPVLDLRELLGGDFFQDALAIDGGVRDFAFHPDFENPDAPGSGKLYVAYTATPGSAGQNPGVPLFTHDRPGVPVDHHDVLAELTLDPETLAVEPGSFRELLRIEQPGRNHNIGYVGFDPNAEPGDVDYGKLYTGIGDGGSSEPTAEAFGQGQDPSTLLGTIIRIDPLRSGDQPYTVPEDNPFVGRAGFLPEIWAYGLRHPEFLSWDPGGGGRMIFADIGEANIEEVNLGIPGANYGWGEREGTFVVEQANRDVLYELPPHDALRGYTYPVAQYDHDEGIAIVGGFVYRGDAVPELVGKYVFGDIVNGRVFYVDVDDLRLGRQAEIRELTLVHEGEERTLLEILGDDARADLRFGQDEAGELYLMSKRDGVIRGLRPVDGAPAASAEALSPEELLDDGGGGPPPAGPSALAAVGVRGRALDDLLGDISPVPA